MKCPCCNSEQEANAAICPVCSFPLAADIEKQRQFLQRKVIVAETEQSDALELVGKSKYILYFAAALTAVRAISVFWKAGGTVPGIVLGIVSVLVCCGLVYLGRDIEKHPMRNAIIGLIATFLIMGGGIIGWVATLVMIFCVYSAVVYERKRKEVTRLQTILEKP